MHVFGADPAVCIHSASSQEEPSAVPEPPAAEAWGPSWELDMIRLDWIGLGVGLQPWDLLKRSFDIILNASAHSRDFWGWHVLSGPK